MNAKLMLSAIACLEMFLVIGARVAPAAPAGVDPLAKLVDDVAEKLDIELKEQGSERFLLLSDCSAGERLRVLRNGEAIYRTLDKKFLELCPPEDDGPLWEGQRVILLFRNKQEYTDYWYKMKGASGEIPFAKEAQFGPDLSGFVAANRAGEDVDLTEAFYLYLTPIFMKRSMEGKAVPSWLRTGFTLYCQHVMGGDKGDADRARLYVKQNVQQGDDRGFATIQKTAEWPTSDPRGRYLCFSWVDYLISLGEKKFSAFMEELRGGADPNAAMKEAFGKTPEELEKGWRKHIDGLRGEAPRLRRAAR